MGLNQTYLGNYGLRKIPVSANTPPPSKKSLQKTSNIVMGKVEMLNVADMSRRCRQLVDINRLRGSNYPHVIPVQCDELIHCTRGLARHRSSRWNKLCTPLLRMSPRGGRSKNKIYSKHGHLLDESDANHYCSPGSVVCGANLPMQHIIEDEYTC